MRYSSEDISHSIEENVKQDLRKGVWSKADQYELAPSSRGGRYVVSVRGYPYYEAKGWNKYQPLVSYPGLFLNFARLGDRLEGYPLQPAKPGVIHLVFGYPDTENNVRLALRWAKTYGVLGLTTYAEGFADPKGGPKDSVSAFCEEVRDAHTALELYEAATTRPPDINAIARLYPGPSDPDEIADRQDPEYARMRALEAVVWLVEQKVGENCFPVLFKDEGSLSQGWGFKNLLGAMWLQMMWLMTSRDTAPRCQFSGCNRIIRFEKPEYLGPDPGLKKNFRGLHRKHKHAKFCSTNCRVKHWQHAQKENQS